jgi:hypothetical protein
MSLRASGLSRLVFYSHMALIPLVTPRFEIAETKPPYVCLGCLIHTYTNNMINMCHIQ